MSDKKDPLADLVAARSAAEVPSENDLPQGVKEFLRAHKALHEAIFQLHAPFLDVAAPLRENYAQASRLAREIGFYINDSITLIMHPELAKKGKKPEVKVNA